MKKLQSANGPGELGEEHEFKISRVLKILTVYMNEVVSSETRPNVKTLCARAGISRPTFYAYFEGVEDLDSRFLALLYDLKFRYQGFDPQDMAGLHAYLMRLFDFTMEHRGFFLAFFTRKDMSHYFFHFRELIRSEAVRLFPNITHSQFTPCHLDLIVGAILTTLHSVVMVDRSLWPVLATAVVDFTFGGFLGLLREDSTQWNQEKMRVFRALRRNRPLVNFGS